MRLLGRREFLAGGAGAAVLGGYALQPLAVDPAPAEIVDPRTFGAKGDGRSNDVDALNRALARASATGRPLDGGGAQFALAGSLSLSGANRPWIRSLRLRQLAPVNGQSSLQLRHCSGIRIDSLQIDVGGSKRLGDMNSTFGLWIEGGANHSVRNVEAFGHGKNSLIAIWHTASSTYERLHVHDAQFDDPGASDDVMQGIWLYGNSDCLLSDAIVTDLTGNATYVGRRFANLRTRGIVLTGNRRVSIRNSFVRNVEQGIDITGSDGNLQCAVIGGRSADCGSVGVKLANSAVGCSVTDHVAERIGMYAFLASGPAEPNLRYKTQDCEFLRCVAVDAGYNRISYPNPSGFQVRTGDYDRDFPKNIRFTACRAVDRQAVKTMRYGFFSDVPASTRPNVMIDCASEGHIIAGRGGAWR